MNPEEQTYEGYSLGDRFASAVIGSTIHPDEEPRLVYSVRQIVRIFIMRELHLPYEAEQQAMALVSGTINHLGDKSPVFVTDINFTPSPKPVDEPTE